MKRNLKDKIEKILNKTIEQEIGGGYDFDETTDQLLSLFSDTVDRIIKVRIGENLGMSRLDSHQKTAIKGVLFYIRARKKSILSGNEGELGL